MFLGRRARPVRGILNISQPYKLPMPVTWIALLSFFFSHSTVNIGKERLGSEGGIQHNLNKFEALWLEEARIETR
jgi:hypothetical protein